MTRFCCFLLIVTAPLLLFAQQSENANPKRLLIAFSSYRDRPKHAQVYFYEHDGVSQGKMVGNIPTVTNRQDYHPILSRNGKLCVFASELENEVSKIFVWDMEQKKLLTPAKLNASPNAQLHPTINADATIMAYASWDKPGSSQRWDVMLYDLVGQKFLDTPGLNTTKYDERMPALSADGRWLAYVSNHKDGVGAADIWLYDRKENKSIALPEINSPFVDITPSLSADGNLIAFASDRPTGKGERDIYLYDRQTQKLLPTPGLNSKRDDIDPCVIVLE